MDHSAPRIHIIGGGIAGLSAALALVHLGMPIHIYERANHFEDIGAGVQLWPNAVKALYALGVDEGRLLEYGRIPLSFDIYNAACWKLLRQFDMRGMARRFGAPAVTILRADLHTLLWKTLQSRAEAGQVSVHFGHSIVKTQKKQLQYDLHFSNGSVVTTGLDDYVFLADGVFSLARREVYHDVNPKLDTNAVYAGYKAYRALSTEDVHFVRVYFARGWHGVFYPVGSSPNRSTNCVLIARKPISHEELLIRERQRRILSFHQVISEVGADEGRLPRNMVKMIGGASEWLEWPLFQAPDLPTYHFSKQGIILGDAAHGITPFAAQGAAMALEDGAVLLHILRQTAQLSPQVLARWNKQRQGRVALLKKIGRQNAQRFHMSALPAFFRDQVIRHISIDTFWDIYRDVYGVDF